MIKVTLIASAVSLAVGGYFGYKVANDELQEYIQASLKAYNEVEQLNKEAMIGLSEEKDKTISELLVKLEQARDTQQSISSIADRVYNDTRSSNNKPTTVDDPCKTLRETLSERTELLGRCSKLLERGSKEYTESSINHDSLVDIVSKYLDKQKGN